MAPQENWFSCEISLEHPEGVHAIGQAKQYLLCQVHSMCPMFQSISNQYIAIPKSNYVNMTYNLTSYQKCVIITSSQHFPFTILDLQPNGLKFMTLSSASLKYPSVLKILFLSLSLEVSAVPPLLEICCFILCLDMKFWFRLSLFWCFCSASLFDLPLWPWPFNLIFNKWR